jgi:hypothetical protein
MDAMIRANAAANLAAADVTITVALDGYSPNDFGRTRDLIRAGYDAAEAARARLLPLAVDEAQWQAWLDRPPRPDGIAAAGAGVRTCRRRRPE